MFQYHLEELKEEHLTRILEIYNYYVINTTVTFHMHPLTVDEMKELVFFDDPRYKTFVLIEDDNIYGYVILSQYKKREAYIDTAEVSVYLKPDLIGKGLGGFAVNFIEDYAKKLEVHVLIAAISGDNKNSIKLFEKNHYTKCAHYREVGKKFGKLLDVVAYQKIV